MSDGIKLTRITLACGLALGWALSGTRGARAATGDHLAAVRDEQGRVVYVNADVNTAGSARSGSSSFSPHTGSPSVIGFIQQASERLQLDPGLLHAVIRVESDYNPRAVSPKGAMGLMQLIPSTARRFGVGDPFDPQQNIDGGAHYLRYLLQLFSGDVPRSLAAYNAGEQSVVRSVQRDGGIPRIHETQEYVRKVTAAYSQGSGVGGQGAGFRIQDPATGATRAITHRGIEPRQPRTPNPEPPIYSFVDAQGVVHFEQ